MTADTGKIGNSLAEPLLRAALRAAITSNGLSAVIATISDICYSIFEELSESRTLERCNAPKWIIASEEIAKIKDTIKEDLKL